MTYFPGEYPSYRSTILADDSQSESTRRSSMLGNVASFDRLRGPGYVQDDVWCLVNVDPAAQTLRRYIGGNGFGDGDPAFCSLVKKYYIASNVDEFRRPRKLRERLTATEGSVTYISCLMTYIST